ncbi:Ig-like domain-containing protein [Kineosporia sp. A_224]|uniref:L,D-transpeptidase n=1 Tax=Kineosporia sp. A_224 TaxID=1962180 RepID=UPI001E342DE5|nr:Ig-like domain-containing protein [Kineosporia sp. A_224]
MRTSVRIWGAGLVAVLALSGCTAGTSSQADAAGGGSPSAGGSQGQTSSPAAQPVSVTVTPKDDATKVRPDAGVSVAAAQGRITSVKVTAADGTKVAGDLSDDGASWKNTAHLAPAATYTVKVAAQNADGVATTVTSTFKTLRPAGFAGASLQPSDGWVVGVGMPVVVTFDSTVKNRAKVEKALKVTATPAIEGAWRWTGSRQVQWRPKEFWKTGTKVKVVADLKGVEVSPGVWGKRTRTADFEIGSAMVSTVDIAAHTMTVRKNGKVIKVIPVTTGKPGLATRNGTKVIISRETTHRMDAATTGVSQDSPEYYNLVVKYAMRLTWSGEFVHAAPWSVGSQGRANVSHGCTGMSTANAAWIFEHSKVGDVVKYVHGSRKLEDGNGYTAWNMSFDQWANA